MSHEFGVRLFYAALVVCLAALIFGIARAA